MGDIMGKVKEHVRNGLAKAKEFLENVYGGIPTNGVDLNRAAMDLGKHLQKKIVIKNADLTKMQNGISGFTIVKEDGIYIVVNSVEPPHRQRFTIAHELGHIYLHDININEVDKLNVVFRSDFDFSSNDPEKLMIEQRANAFASEILMPEDQVLKLIDAGLNSTQMAEIFGVSIQAMEIRLAGILY